MNIDKPKTPQPKSSLNWFLSGWIRALHQPMQAYPLHAAERIPNRHFIAAKRKVDSLKCDNCGHQAKYFAFHIEAGNVMICESCNKSHFQEHSYVRPIKIRTYVPEDKTT